MARTMAAIAALAGTPAAAHAQAGARAISLDEALAMARLHNRDLRAARARLAQSATNIEQAWVALLPQVTAQGKYTHNYKEIDVNLAQATQPVFGLANVIKATSGNPAQNGAINQFTQDVAAGIQAQPVPIINKLDQLDFALNAQIPLIVPSAYSALTGAKRTHGANQANYDVTEASLLYSVAQAYFAAAGADELVVARKNAIQVARETYDNARARFDAGVVNRVEVTRAEVALVRAEQTEAEAEDSAAQAYRGLGTLIGTHEEFRAVPSELPTAEAPPAAVLVDRALALRPDFLVLTRSIAAADDNARAGGLRWLPSLSAFGNVRAFNYQGFSGDFYSWAIGAQLDWTLYDGGARDAQRHLAWAQRQENEARLELLRDSITDDVVNTRRALTTKRRALDAARRSLELSRETLVLVRAQHDAGTAKQLDLLTAQDQLVDAEVAMAQARFDLALAALLLERNAGTFPAKLSTRNER
ncbi:MAG TPA: TolC family protein [Polyangia bacterium]|nr:TolC family protein [Polyangia bacterium]